MNIQPTFNAGPSSAAQQASQIGHSGGTSPGAGEGMRADWNVRMNVSHETGFVGGAGRLLIHNQTADERTELVLYLPAARPAFPHGRLELASAVVCSAKPGTPAQPGQTLAFRSEGARIVLTVPLLRMNDWLYVDLTWTGSFPKGGAGFPSGMVPLGEFHPQVAVDVQQDDGTKALYPLPARYDVELGADRGTKVRLESDGHGEAVERSSEDGGMTMHEFKSYGKAHIQASLAPAGALLGPSMPAVPQPPPLGTTPRIDGDAPTFLR